MIDFSIFFIIFRLLGDWAIKAVAPNILDVLLVVCSATLICLIVFLVLPREKDDKPNATKNTFRTLTIYLLIVLAVVLIIYFWPYVLSGVESNYNISGIVFTEYAVGIGLLLLGIIPIIMSRFCSTEPNNQSLCNKRQALSWFGYFALFLFFIVAFYSINYEVFFKTVFVVFFLCEIISLLFWFYDPIIYILSRFVKEKRAQAFEPTPSKINRFAVIGCAHNEATVIDQLVKSVYATNYPKNKYDVYVICDNCTDETADVVRKAGAIAMERVNADEKGKGFALKWMFEYLDNEREKENEYDAYIILDADNVVNEEFLDAINDKVNEGYEILQCYLGCKNPKDTFVSASYSYSYWVSNTLYQQAHARAGLSAQMGGTGMVIRPSVLDDIGWATDSLTEDLVLTSRYIIEKNKSCSWVHDAKLYDEKPLKLVPSIRQRTRWMQGHMAAMFKYAPGLIRNGFTKLSFKSFDMAFYLLRPFLTLALFAAYMFRIFFNVFMPETMSIDFVMSTNTSLLLLLGSILLQLFILFIERYTRYMPVFLVQLVFSFSWYPAMLRGLVKRNERYWVSTVHTRNISLSDIGEDVMLIEARERLQGLDNLHKMPLGQILLKATVISKPQLDAALARQKESGGFLGDIIVDMNAINPETLDAYLSIQQSMREIAESEGHEEKPLRLGDILVDARLITQNQLSTALNYQKKYGGYLGDALIITHCLPIELLNMFLDIQKLFDANYISKRNASHFIDGLLSNSTEFLGDILWEGGLLSKQQLDYALEQQAKDPSKQIGTILVEHEFINKETLDLILSLQRSGREFLQRKNAEKSTEESGQ